jgi:type IV pilus biogenesis protein CpaD/CtpE
MKLSPARVSLLLLVILAAVLAGCSSETPSDSSIPWNQPADWEGQIPGMTGSGSQVH